MDAAPGDRSAAVRSTSRAMAVDYDGALTNGGEPMPVVLEALRSFRGDGGRVVLATGRILAELAAVLPDAADHVDAIVAENGAVLHVRGRTRLLADTVAVGDAENDHSLPGRPRARRRGGQRRPWSAAPCRPRHGGRSPHRRASTTGTSRAAHRRASDALGHVDVREVDRRAGAQALRVADP